MQLLNHWFILDNRLTCKIDIFINNLKTTNKSHIAFKRHLEDILKISFILKIHFLNISWICMLCNNFFDRKKSNFCKIIIFWEKPEWAGTESFGFSPRLFALAMRLQNITMEGRSSARPLGRLYPPCSYVHRLPRLQTVSKKYSTDDCIESDCAARLKYRRVFLPLAGRTYSHHSVYTLWHKCARSSRAILLPCYVMNR